MLRLIKLTAIIVFLSACGKKSDDSNLASDRTIAPHGFVLTSSTIVPESESCGAGQHGARWNFNPLKQTNIKPYSAKLCFTSVRQTTDARKNLGRESEGSAEYADETLVADFKYPTDFKKYCTEEKKNNFGAAAYYGSDFKDVNDEIDTYSCEDLEPDKVVGLGIQKFDNPTAFFDMKAIEYFPNLRYMAINSYTITNTKNFKAPPSLAFLNITAFTYEPEKQLELVSNIVKNIPSLKYIQISPPSKTAIPNPIDISFVSEAPGLRILTSFVSVTSLTALEGHPSIEILEFADSPDRLSGPLSLPNLSVLRFEVDTTSNINWADRFEFEIGFFNFER